MSRLRTEYDTQTAHLASYDWYCLQLYPRYAVNSPFLLDQLDSYFLGGVDDMAAWSDRIWNQTVSMLDHGTEYVTDMSIADLYSASA